MAEAEGKRAEEQQKRLVEQRRSAARLKWLVAGMAVVAAAAVVASVVAVLQGNKAKVSAAVAEDAKSEALGSASRLKSALAIADFDSSYRQLEEGDATQSLLFAARSMRTDPSFWPSGFLAVSTLTERSFHQEKPVVVQMENQGDIELIN